MSTPEFPFQPQDNGGGIISADSPTKLVDFISVKTRLGTDWKAEFRPEELVEKGDAGRCVRLRGLQRCANLCGLVKSFPVMTYIEGRNGSPGIMQCVYHVIFNDGTHFAGAGDVNERNIDPKFAAYPTSVAESRAEARALRKALNITDMLAAEEVGSSEGGSTGQPETNVNGKIEPQQVAAINAIIDQLKLPIANVLNEVLPSARAKSVFSLDELTVAEAVSILRNLNEKRASLDTQPQMGNGKKINIDKKGG